LIKLIIEIIVLARKVHQVHRVHPEQLEQQVHKVHPEQLEQQVHKVLIK
jgi:hypothetical protein